MNPSAITDETGRRSSLPAMVVLAALFLLSAWSTTFILTDDNQMVLSTGILVALWTFSRFERTAGEFHRVVVIVLGSYLSLRYWMFRTTATLSYTGLWDFIFLMLLYLAETYGIFTHLVGLFVNVAPIRRRRAPLPADRSLCRASTYWFRPTMNRSKW
jgi:cellulose synthase (UDP-forming)